jgi:hypothetical protein
MLKPYYVNSKLDMVLGTWTQETVRWTNEAFALCKGDNTAQEAEAQTAAFQQTLMNSYQQQYASQTNILNYLNSKMQTQINAGGQGYNPATLAAMRASASDQTASATQNAIRGSQNQQFNEGGENLPSGVNAQINAAIQTAGAQTEAESQQGITEQNAQLQNANYWNAVGTLGGVAGQFNPNGSISGVTSAASGIASLSQANTAASGPTFGALLGTAIGGAAQVGAAFCPAKGSMYLMWDYTEKPVETLKVGDILRGIDDEPCVIEEIQSGLSTILYTVTDDGLLLRTSPTHAFALPRGGFVVAARSAGKVIATEAGTSTVISTHIRLAKDWVFNIITGGSHTYRCDGVWSLGVGDAERQVGMNVWEEIGDRLAEEVA